MFEEFSVGPIAEADSYAHFSIRAERGNRQGGLKTLGTLDSYYKQ